jgi:hypothetical protein
MNKKDLAKIAFAVLVAIAVFTYVIDPMVQKYTNKEA